MHNLSEMVGAWLRGPCLSSLFPWLACLVLTRTYDSDIDETADSHSQIEHGQLQGLSIRVILLGSTSGSGLRAGRQQRPWPGGQRRL